MLFVHPYIFQKADIHTYFNSRLERIYVGGVFMDKRTSKKLGKDFSDKQNERKNMSHQFDHEFANEPLTAEDHHGSH